MELPTRSRLLAGYFGVIFVYVVGTFFLKNYEIKKECLEKSRTISYEIVGEINRAIWGLGLAFLDVYRSDSSKPYQIEWYCEGQKKIQDLSNFKLKIKRSKGEESTVGLEVSSEELHLPHLLPILKGYIINFDSEEIANMKESSEVYSKKLGLEWFHHRSLITPNLIVIVGLSPDINLFFILKSVWLNILLGLIVLTILAIYHLR